MGWLRIGALMELPYKPWDIICDWCLENLYDAQLIQLILHIQ
jgi:hypothetical protein